jgi:DNA polymerase delta subunit 1
VASSRYKFQLYEANFPPHLRCFHIQNISGCAWVETKYYDIISEDKKSRCNTEIEVDWRNIHTISRDINAPLKICSFDIECNSIDGEFPQARRPGDKIIQIGFTYTLLGEYNPYRQHIICLNETDKFDKNVIVTSVETEHELLYEFLKEINNNDCDIITGYNIFFFDEKYIHDRAILLNIDLSDLSKLVDHKSPFIEIKLASSALGENILKFWNTPGRIHIDLMKDIQKTFSLQSYKLDSVVSKFIRGNINKFNINSLDIDLCCDNIDNISIGDFIHIECTE